MKNWRTWQWISILLAIVCTLFWEYYPLEDAVKRLNKLPTQGANYLGRDIALSDNERAIFKDVHIIKRQYIVNNEPYAISIIDGTHNRGLVHDPTYCFYGSGWKIIEKKYIKVPKGEAVVYTMVRGFMRKQALLVFSNGRSQYTSMSRYWRETVLRRLTLGYSHEEPVRIIVQTLRPLSKSTPAPNWEDFVRNFPELWEI